MARSPKLSVDPPFQPLRIPTGWNVAFNTFYEVDPKFRSWDDNFWNFKEDMLLLENTARGVYVDLGWYPEFQSKGQFVLVAVRLIHDPEYGQTGEWDRPLRKLRTRSRKKVVAAIEAWLNWYSRHPPRARRKKTELEG